jgi:putative DNA primase/helicase
LVVATEQPSDFVNSTHVINALVSGEEITVEKKFKDSYSVVPRAKICWAMNELPRVGDANNGLFRRVKVVAFPRLETSPDPTIKRKVRHEGAGILRWALEGLGRLGERGAFEIPDSVLEATNEFRKTNDVPGLFVRDACSVSPAAKVRAAKLYEAYAHWCRSSGHKPQSATSVSKEWVRLGFEKRLLNGRTVYGGLELDPKWVGEQRDYPLR